MSKRDNPRLKQREEEKRIKREKYFAAKEAREKKAKEAEIKNLQTLLDNQMNILENPDLRATFISYVSNFNKVALTGGKPSYLRFVYYAQRLNEMKHLKFIIKKYPNYCSTVLYTMAKEYVLLKKKLEADYKAIQPFYDKKKWALFDSYKAIMEKGVAVLYTQATACAQKEAATVINQIKQSV